MGLAPVPYSIHVRSRSAARPVDALTTPSSSDDPFTFACDASGVSGPFTGVSGFRHSRDPSPFGHRSSPEAPSLHRHYPASPVLRASPPPCRPSLPLTGSRFGACLTTHRASHVAAFFSFHACQRHYPGGSKGVPASLASPSVFGLPHFSGGSAPALPVSRPAQRSLRVAACVLAESPTGDPSSSECFSAIRYLPAPLRLLPAGATVAGRDSHPLGHSAFPRRTLNLG
jgi:hypothetical protein